MAGDCWNLRCDIEKLLNAEFQDMKSRLGCDDGDNVKASSAMLKIVAFIRAVNQDAIDSVSDLENEE
jgi:hypothetical protein